MRLRRLKPAATLSGKYLSSISDHLIPYLQSKIQSLHPVARFVQGYRGIVWTADDSIGVAGGHKVCIDVGIDLITRPENFRPIHEAVADEELDAFRNAITEVEPDFGNYDEIIVGIPTDVAAQGQKSAFNAVAGVVLMNVPPRIVRISWLHPMANLVVNSAVRRLN